jgi:hypothetical protein
MASSEESRKDIFKLDSQGQLELPGLTSKSPLNKIEFKQNDGIYINGVRLATSGGEPVGNTTIADYTSPDPAFPVTTTPVTLGRTVITFDALDYHFGSIEGDLIIPFVENPAKPYSAISKIVPIIKQSNVKANNLMGCKTIINYVFDKVGGVFSMSFRFSNFYGYDGFLKDFSIEINFLVA